MVRRPVCLLCVLLMAVMCIVDLLGFPLIRGNPLPDSQKAWIAQHPESTICGEVERCEDTEFSQSIYLKQTYLIYKSEKISIENVRVFLKSNEKVPAGALLLLSGKLERVTEQRNPGEFDSRQFYACRHIYYFLKKAVIKKQSNTYSRYGQFLLDMRERFAQALEASAGEDAPIFSAIVLGDKSNLDEETKLKYQMAGIIHMLAISGLHISVLGMGLYQLLKRLGLGIWPAGMLSLVVMLQYGMMTGGSVSTMRAVCMFLLSVGAKILGRIYDMMTALSVAAILLLLDTPAYLYSSSFLLSFGAVLGLGTVAPVLTAATGLKGKVSRTFVSSLAVQLTTLPVALWFYGEVSVAGIFLNLVVLPTVGVVLASGVGAVFLGCISPVAGQAVILPGRVLLLVYETLCQLAGGLPLCTWIGGQPRIYQVVLYYGILAAVLAGNAAVRHRTDQMAEQDQQCEKKSGLSFLRMAEFLCCAAGLAAGIAVLGFRNRGYLKITCLDVGQGDGIVLETPEGSHFLIDGGSSNKSAVGQYQIAPYLKSQGISYLDGIFISHTDNDHINGVCELLTWMGERLTTIRAGSLFLPGWSEKPEAWEELSELAEKAGIQVVSCNRGDTLRAGKVRLSLLAPVKGADGADVNEDGMVIQAEYGSFQGLFTGDIGEETEKALLQNLVDVDFLKVGHHGSRYSSCSAFLDKIRPELAVISCSSTNTYGHPSQETIERLEAGGCQVEYTMKSGAVTVITDGKRVSVERFAGGER